MTKVSFTYRSHRLGLWSAVISEKVSNSSMKMLARTGDIGDPMEVSVICLKNWSWDLK